MQRSWSKNFMYRSWLVFLRRHGRCYTRRRCRPLRRLARSRDRWTPVRQTSNRYWFLNQCFGDQPSRSLVGHARSGLQFRHRNISHVSSVWFYKQRSDHERRFQVPCQSERIPLRVCALFCWQITGCLLNRYSNRLQRGVWRRKSSPTVQLLAAKSAGWHYLQTYIFANFLYVGPLKEGMALIQPLIDLGPFDQNITMIPWKDIQTSSKFGIDALACIKGNFHSVWGLNLYQIDVPTLISAVNYMDTIYAQYPVFHQAFLAIDMYASRVIESVPDDVTAYPYRNATARL